MTLPSYPVGAALVVASGMVSLLLRARTVRHRLASDSVVQEDLAFFKARAAAARSARILPKLSESPLPTKTKLPPGLTYGGHDYIAKVFPTWLEDPDTHRTVGVVHEESQSLAALGMIRFDAQEPDSAFVEAIRVHPAHRGMGLSHCVQAALNEHARDFVAPRDPEFRYLKYTLYNENKPAMAIVKKAGFLRTEIFPYIMLADALEGDDVAYISHPGVTLREYADRVRRLRSEGRRAHLVPAYSREMERVVSPERRATCLLSWKPIQTISVYEYLEPAGPGQSRVTRDDAERLLGVSFGTEVPGGLALLCHFGPLSADPVEKTLDLLDHINSWFESAFVKKIGGFWMSYEIECHSEMLRLGLASDLRCEELWVLDVRV